MKYNPFQPNGMVAPGMFVGRIDELKAIEQSLFQTKNGNPHPFLIQGERGIGKSSLFGYVDLLASGVTWTMGQEKLHFLTISVDLNGCAQQIEIVQAIARGLRRSLTERNGIRERAKKVWEFLSNWEVLGVRYHKDTNGTWLEDARDQLVDKVVEVTKAVGTDIDGILILIDEADNPGPGANLGQFLKLFTERLARRQCRTVLLGMAGLPSIIGQLKESHESAPRIFETFILQPLEPHERETVIYRGLQEAQSKNGVEIKITPEALSLLCELSEGYPHFVQQFAYSAFAEDTDNVIDVEDVKRGAFKENGALAQLGNKYFDGMYKAVVSENYRRVLDVMALHGDAWLSRQKISRESKISDSNVNNALASLKERKIIIQDDGRRGYYRLPTKSFAAWINATRAAPNKENMATLFSI